MRELIVEISNHFRLSVHACGWQLTWKKTRGQGRFSNRMHGKIHSPHSPGNWPTSVAVTDSSNRKIRIYWPSL
ncbi:hypothetical protein BC937DRAFT_93134 [Endogone sp. FLAS-F59071]|nr:hypothetical protein BC937DRAFT_93134 [Endogone sp. FLAS-F59071]|eukprot:RUS21276.1 hypothetical protein BC937DRAFT_93134 [Endogone sp. FLAS-F59071]